MDADLIELLTSNLSRLDEKVDTDRAGVYYILGTFLYQAKSAPAKFCKVSWRT
jgi:hypothetical protein